MILQIEITTHSHPIKLIENRCHSVTSHRTSIPPTEYQVLLPVLAIKRLDAVLKKCFTK